MERGGSVAEGPMTEEERGLTERIREMRRGAREPMIAKEIDDSGGTTPAPT